MQVVDCCRLEVVDTVEEPPGFGYRVVELVVELGEFRTLLVVVTVDEPPGFGLSVVEAPGFP
jgi:hypothetical protein